jgi:ParB family transcriptional regulator, chromosome partitioning protein
MHMPATKTKKPKTSINPQASNGLPSADRLVASLPLDMIVGSTRNPRKAFDQDAIDALANSILANGLLQPILVNASGDDGLFEIICGERRYRATQQLGLTRIECHIVPMTPAQADMARLAENLDRQDLSPIEEAQGFAAAIEAHGLTQQQLGQQLGCSQAKIANALRLLKLPASWQQRLANGEITANVAKEVLLPLAEHPEVLANLDEAIRAGDATAEELSGSERAELVEQAINESTTLLECHRWDSEARDSLKWKWTDAEKQQLDLRTIAYTDRWGQEREEERVFNLSAYNTLLGTKLDAARAKAKAKNAKATEAHEPTVADDAAAQAAKLKQANDQLRAAYARYRVDWHLDRLAGLIPAAPVATILRLLLWTALGGDTGPRAEAAKTAKLIRDKFRPKLSELPASCEAAARQQVLTWLDIGWAGYKTPLTAEVIVSAATELGVDLVEDWECEEVFLQLHNKTQLATLITAWKLKAPAGGWPEKRGDLIAAIAAASGVKSPPKLLKQVTSEEARGR